MYENRTRYSPRHARIYNVPGAYEGRSVQLRGTAFDDCDTSLLWTYSEVGHKCCFHSQRITRVCVIPRAARRRTCVYIRRWRVAIVNYDSRSQRWSRKGKAKSKGSESGKLRRHIGLQKDLGYSRRSCEVRPCLAPRK